MEWFREVVEWFREVVEWFREVVEWLAELVGWFCGGKMWPRAVGMGGRDIVGARSAGALWFFGEISQ